MYLFLTRFLSFFFFQAEDGIRDVAVTGVQTCALPISSHQRTSEGYSGRDRAVRSPSGCEDSPEDRPRADRIGTGIADASRKLNLTAHARQLESRDEQGEIDDRADDSADRDVARRPRMRSEEHTSELQSRLHLVCRL